jgi:hypothetical protein
MMDKKPVHFEIDVKYTKLVTTQAGEPSRA